MRRFDFVENKREKTGSSTSGVDTCCINKDNHVELSKAITLMLGWYGDAKKCYVYLSDVSVRKATTSANRIVG